MKTIRYVLKEPRVVLNKPDGTKETINVRSKLIFVDILKHIEGNAGVEVKLFFPNGEIKTGIIVDFCIGIYNDELLYDGRFNSTQNSV